MKSNTERIYAPSPDEPNDNPWVRNLGSNIVIESQPPMSYEEPKEAKVAAAPAAPPPPPDGPDNIPFNPDFLDNQDKMDPEKYIDQTPAANAEAMAESAKKLGNDLLDNNNTNNYDDGSFVNKVA